ncbi:aldo/keto reductase [Ascoidea rubescens DSM 1968]|uniref:Aldo/keto reductase n=1 Tax=Ascoidea rubescens DSM 1968 TaxID=1344418 RepID=A0A1D2VJJ0_9ASCO|nr:Aldo/keto reductase [Ascoidea rubescens DSM 1968]ODV61778.1 Aldo/keto reductase [Ascoidea rubescens DSM 1968]
MKYFTLSNGVRIPAIAFGSGTKWQIIKKKGNVDPNLVDHSILLDPLIQSLISAVDLGFEHIDTAEVYTTHNEVRLAIALSKSKREDLFICDKYFSGFRDIYAVSKGPYEACTKALKELDVDYIDLYLIHSSRVIPEYCHGLTLETAWKEMEQLYIEGKVRAIGVSSWSKEHLTRIFKTAKIKPMVNQIEFHPYLQNQSPGIIAFCKENNILIEAFTPLARNHIGLAHSILTQLSEKYNKTYAQIILRWVYQQGILPITTSSKPERITQALEIFNFELTEDEILQISNAGKNETVRFFCQAEYGHYDK